ncbi:acetyltransferase [Colletotrichum musicola]|uniref:Acetyltransferase n=1 Tax=Colletotrichum musicola TaxID=2175873 RepID=A0A8H6MHT3_9PEZI|nr:acetyltransferase [Colletotrichum musicola]
MAIEILPTIEADCPRLAQIDKAAFEASSDSAFEHVLFPLSGTDDASAAKEAMFARAMREDTTARFIKAVDTELSGDAGVVGWAKWHIWDGERGMPPGSTPKPAGNSSAGWIG